MKTIDLGPTDILTAKPLIEKLEDLNIGYKVELTRGRDEVVSQKDLFGLPYRLNSVVVKVAEDDFFQNKQLFHEYGFATVSENLDPFELRPNLDKPSDDAKDKKLVFLFFGYELNYAIHSAASLLALASIFYSGPSAIPRIYLYVFVAVFAANSLFNWLLKRFKKSRV